MAALGTSATSEPNQWICVAPQPATEDGDASIPATRYGHTALLHRNRWMIVTHGYYHSKVGKGGVFLDDTWCFDVQTLAWRRIGPGAAASDGGASTQQRGAVPLPRFEHTAVADGGKYMYLFAGTDGGRRNNGGRTYLFGPEAEMSDLWRFSLGDHGVGGNWDEVLPASPASAPASAPAGAGVPGEEAAAMWPGARCEHGSAWASGLLWVFGGLEGDASGSADGITALCDLWSCAVSETPRRRGKGGSPEAIWSTHAIVAAGGGGDVGGGSGAAEPAVSARYGHGMVAGRWAAGSGGKRGGGSDGFFVLGGRQRSRTGGARELLGDFWFCDTSADAAMDTGSDGGGGGGGGGGGPAWHRLEAPGLPGWEPRFHFAMAALPAGGFLVLGGNVSPGLLRLPVDGWVFRGGQGSTEDETGGETGVGTAGGWRRFDARGAMDDGGHEHPYGRVHATAVVVASGAASGSDDVAVEGASTVLLFGGESTRPYMYHSSVWRVSVD